MKKIILSLLIVVGIFGAGQMVFADSATLSVLPASSDSVVGSTINVSVKLDPAGNKVCVVKGVLNFNNLSCQSISVADGIMAQVNPTCAKPNFTLGIPNCATIAKNLLSVLVKGTAVGQAGLSFSGVKIIGAGADVPFSPQNGVYNITAVKTITPKVTTKVVTNAAVKTAPEATQQVAEPQEQQTVQQTAVENNNIPADAAAASLSTTGSKYMNYFWVLLIVIVVLGVFYGIYYFAKKRGKNKLGQ